MSTNTTILLSALMLCAMIEWHAHYVMSTATWHDLLPIGIIAAFIGYKLWKKGSTGKMDVEKLAMQLPDFISLTNFEPELADEKLRTQKQCYCSGGIHKIEGETNNGVTEWLWQVKYECHRPDHNHLDPTEIWTMNKSMYKAIEEMLEKIEKLK